MLYTKHRAICRAENEVDGVGFVYSNAQENSYKILIGKPEGKGQFCRPRRRQDGNSKMDFKEI